MSTVTDRTHELFRTASFSDDDLGYPDDVEFVPGDQEWADDVVWSNLAQGLATVVVNEESELVLLPRHRSLLDKLRGRVAVNIGLPGQRPRACLHDRQPPRPAPVARNARALARVKGFVTRLQAVSARVLGRAPDRSAPKVERLEWLRRLYLRTLPVNVLVYTIAVAASGMFDIASLLIGAATVISLLGWLSLTLQIRRLRRSEPIP